MRFFPEIHWKGKEAGKVIYLTFDDGPDQESTQKLINILAKYQIKATFFCLGKRVEENKKLSKKLLQEGHKLGNHTYSHIDAWKNSHKDFIKEVEKANEIIQSNLFRPPYGRLKWQDYKVLKRKYQIVMWSVMLGDWKQEVDKKILEERMIKYLSPGAIYVLHDSSKAIDKLEIALPKFIEFAMDQGYTFETLF